MLARAGGRAASSLTGSQIHLKLPELKLVGPCARHDTIAQPALRRHLCAGRPIRISPLNSSRHAEVNDCRANATDPNNIASGSDPYANLKKDFELAEALVAATAVAQGATDGGAFAVAEAYHARLVPDERVQELVDGFTLFLHARIYHAAGCC